MGDTLHNPWTILSSRDIYENAWLKLVEHAVRTPAGTNGIYAVVSPKALAVGVVPFLPNGEILLVGQYRFPLGRYSWEIPEGGAAPGEEPRRTAERELQEETGYHPRQLEPFLSLDLSNSLTDEHAVAFLAWDLVAGAPAPEETEQLAVRHVGFADALDMALEGEITDAISVAALLKLDVLGRRRLLPSAVAPFIGR